MRSGATDTRALPSLRVHQQLVAGFRVCGIQQHTAAFSAAGFIVAGEERALGHAPCVQAE
jgi:hypothetical protein